MFFYCFIRFSTVLCAVICFLVSKYSKLFLIFLPISFSFFVQQFSFSLKMFWIFSYVFTNFSHVLCAVICFLSSKCSNFFLKFSTLSASVVMQLFVFQPQSLLNFFFFFFQTEPFSFGSYLHFSLKMLQIHSQFSAICSFVYGAVICFLTLKFVPKSKF